MTLPQNQALGTRNSADAAAIRIAALEDENGRLKAQLDWFKRQLFGRKSEQQILQNSEQKSLFERDAQAEAAAKNDPGLRFDDTVPQTVIDVPAPELQGEEAGRYDVIGYKENARLAQLRSIFHVLIYRRPVLRHKDEQTLSVPTAPESVLEGSYADAEQWCRA